MGMKVHIHTYTCVYRSQKTDTNIFMHIHKDTYTYTYIHTYINICGDRQELTESFGWKEPRKDDGPEMHGMKREGSSELKSWSLMQAMNIEAWREQPSSLESICFCESMAARNTGRRRSWNETRGKTIARKTLHTSSCSYYAPSFLLLSRFPWLP